MTEHVLKVHEKPFAALASGAKTGEIRVDDRGFQVGDTVLLQEVKLVAQPAGYQYTERELRRTITHIQHGYGLPVGLCVLSYAQSAPAGEREAVEVVGWRIGFPNGAGYKLYEQHQPWAHEEYGPVSYEVQDLMTVAQHERILAAWQRTQSAGVPDVSAMARVLSDRSADACNIDRTDNWAMYGQEYIEDVRAMLAASTGREE